MMMMIHKLKLAKSIQNINIVLRLEFTLLSTFSKPNLHSQKILLVVLWYCNGTAVLQVKQTITAESYCHELELKHKKISNNLVSSGKQERGISCCRMM